MKGKKILAAALLALTLGLTSCNKVTQSYADKINAAAATEKTSDDYTLERVEKDLGRGSGVIVAGAGVETWTVKDKEGKVTATLTVTFLGGVATAAVYVEASQEK